MSGSGCKYSLIGMGLTGLVILVLAAVGVAAYWLMNFPAAPSALFALPPTVRGPAIALQEPSPDMRLGVGDSILVFATARDEKGVTLVDLYVDDVLVVQQASPDPRGATPLNLIHSFVADAPGTRTLIVRAYNSQGAMGLSPIVYVTVAGERTQESATAQYVVQPGDDLQKIAEKTQSKPADIQQENPGIENGVKSGQVIAVPAPAPPEPPPAQAPTPPAQQIPPNAPLQAPTLLGATVKDCSVTLSWRDNSNDELGFVIYRGVSGAPALALLKAEPARSGVGSQAQSTDQVPRPDTYIYYVEAANAVGRAASGTRTVIVPPTTAPNCVQPAGYMQVMFQPRTVTAKAGHERVALFFNVRDVDIFAAFPKDKGATPR